jgi:ribosomal protein S21
MKNYRKREEISGVLEVKNTKDGDNEFLVKKFNRKVRNSGIIEEFRMRTHFVSNSEKRRAKKLEKERLIRKVNQRREGLLSGMGRTKFDKKRNFRRK